MLVGRVALGFRFPVEQQFDTTNNMPVIVDAGAGVSLGNRIPLFLRSDHCISPTGWYQDQVGIISRRYDVDMISTVFSVILRYYRYHVMLGN